MPRTLDHPPQAPALRARRRPRVPYALLAPAVVLLLAALAYPVGWQLFTSLHQFGLAQQFGASAEFVGLDNYARLVADPGLWSVVLRSLAFCLVNAVATMAVGVLLALLMKAVPRPVALVLQVSLLLAWAMPVVAAMTVWRWLFDYRRGVVNHLLTQLGFDFVGHSWLEQPLSFFFVATRGVVWMSVPFVAFSVYAGLTQVPDEVLEAAQIDGANARQRFVGMHPADGAPRPGARAAAAGHLGPAGVRADQAAAGRRRSAQRDQPARHVHLPGGRRLGGLRRRVRGVGVRAGPHHHPELALRADTAARGGAMTTIPGAPARTAAVVRGPCAHDPGPRPGRRRPPARLLARGGLSVLALAVAAFWAFPVYWMLISSLLPNVRLTSGSPIFWPTRASLDNFTAVLEAGTFLPALRIAWP